MSTNHESFCGKKPFPIQLKPNRRRFLIQRQRDGLVRRPELRLQPLALNAIAIALAQAGADPAGAEGADRGRPGMGHNQPPAPIAPEGAAAELPEYVPGGVLAVEPDAGAPGGDPNAVYTVTIDGKAQRVTAAELQRGFMRESDYTQKTQRAAEAMRQAETLAAEFTQARDRLGEQLARFVKAGDDEFGKPINWAELQRTDPITYEAKHARFLDWQEAGRQAQVLADQRSREQSAQQLRMLRQGHEVLSRAIPGWAQDGTRVAIQGQLKAHALAVGFTEAELAANPPVDPRQIVLAYESMLYRQLRGQKIEPNAPALTRHAQGGAVHRPNGRASGPIPGAVDAAAARFEGSHSLSDAMELLRVRRGGAAAEAPSRRRGPALDLGSGRR